MVATENLFVRNQANHKMEQTVTADYSPDILKLPNPDTSVLPTSQFHGDFAQACRDGEGSGRGDSPFSLLCCFFLLLMKRMRSATKSKKKMPPPQMPTMRGISSPFSARGKRGDGGQC